MRNSSDESDARELMIFRAVYRESALLIHENDLSELSRKMSSVSISAPPGQKRAGHPCHTTDVLAWAKTMIGRLAVFPNPERPPSHLREAERGTLSRWGRVGRRCLAKFAWTPTAFEPVLIGVSANNNRTARKVSPVSFDRVPPISFLALISSYSSKGEEIR